VEGRGGNDRKSANRAMSRDTTFVGDDVASLADRGV